MLMFVIHCVHGHICANVVRASSSLSLLSPLLLLLLLYMIICYNAGILHRRAGKHTFRVVLMLALIHMRTPSGRCSSFSKGQLFATTQVGSVVLAPFAIYCGLAKLYSSCGTSLCVACEQHAYAQPRKCTQK
eukprot:gnl/TRDRNA2_/TRDRNA2_157078_c0_seq1.p1 gnl/TRDRNA2_/TRDRNA2_157078_c0~~gnl/TRDRNA2_/TRDRNA2_157078_c0_seq1.p1  ORF type:complete len:132 (+),score=8.03 gnl/TRDRNA2_/TRDRNA2_157078_c0_seq1:122-517(+)